MFPSGVEEGVMPVVGPGLDIERTAGRSADRCVGEALATGLDGAGGEDGEGVSKGVSESKSASGVDAVDAMVSCSVYVAASGFGGVRGGGRGEARWWREDSNRSE